MGILIKNSIFGTFKKKKKTLCNSLQKSPILFSVSILHGCMDDQNAGMSLNILTFLQYLHDFVFHINLLSLPACISPCEKWALLFRVSTRKNMKSLTSVLKGLTL